MRATRWTRFLSALLASFGLSACGSAAAPSNDRANETAQHATEGGDVHLMDGAARELRLTMNRPVTLVGGVRITFLGGTYMHLPGGRNASLCTVRLERGSETREVGLDRDSGAPLHYEEVMGWRIALDYVYPAAPHALFAIKRAESRSRSAPAR